jgi:tRNA (mo5U34)-methyltransferase
MTFTFTRRFRARGRTAQPHETTPAGSDRSLPLPPLPHVDWPGYKAPWPSYMLEGREEKRELIAEALRRHWFHAIDLGDGAFTPISPDAMVRHIHQAFLDTDFTGKKVLDIGCWDGGWSFAAEQRGAAEVYATDLISQRDRKPHELSNFELAHKILNSRVKYFPHIDVYNIHELGVRDFDIIIYMGVFYHVKDPVLVLGRLRQVARPGATILCEGEVIGSERSYAEFYYNEDYARSSSNWWVPSIGCVREWLECNFFQVEREYREHDGVQAYWDRRNNYGRCLTRARALPVPPQSTADIRNYYSRYDFLEP